MDKTRSTIAVQLRARNSQKPEMFCCVGKGATPNARRLAQAARSWRAESWSMRVEQRLLANNMDSIKKSKYSVYSI